MLAELQKPSAAWISPNDLLLNSYDLENKIRSRSCIVGTDEDYVCKAQQNKQDCFNSFQIAARGIRSGLNLLDCMNVWRAVQFLFDVSRWSFLIYSNIWTNLHSFRNTLLTGDRSLLKQVSSSLVSLPWTHNSHFSKTIKSRFSRTVVSLLKNVGIEHSYVFKRVEEE